MKRISIVVVTTLLGVGMLAAQEGPTFMKANGKNLATVLSATVKGEKPYDQASIDTALSQLSDTAAKLPTLFPESLKGAPFAGDFSPAPKIWDDKAGFTAQIAAFAAAVTAAKASVKDLDSLKAALPAIAKSCSGCHED